MAKKAAMFRPRRLKGKAFVPLRRANNGELVQLRHRGSSRQRGYTWQWNKASAKYRIDNPICVCCEAHDVVVPVRVVDHIVPHKGDEYLFWQRSNWQPLCGWCHDVLKQSLEIQWAAGDLPNEDLDFARTVPGWVHPAKRKGKHAAA